MEAKLKEKIINFCQVFNHKIDIVSTALETCIKEWRLEQAVTVTVENASFNDIVIELLEESCRGK